MPTSPLDVHAAAVDRALDDALDRILPPVEALHEVLVPALGHLRAFLAGGKRIRPALLRVGHAAAGGDPERVQGPALALELLHTCALLHDDVIDRAPTRRSRPTVHHAVAEEHRRAGWSGPPLPHGEAVAILLGDLALVQADRLFLEAEVDAQALLAGLDRFTLLREEVMAGQYLDLHAATAGLTDRDLALRIATLKSGRYSVARPLELGAVLAGADPALVEGLGAFGDPLGRAFQIRDDLLGVFGDPQVTGKSVASDLAEGKRTLLIAEAAERLDDAGRATLNAALGDPSLTDERARQVRELLQACGARAACEAYVDAAIAEARQVLATLPVTEAARPELETIAERLGRRER